MDSILFPENRRRSNARVSAQEQSFDLFSQPVVKPSRKAPHNNTETSVQAAKKIEPFAGRMRGVVYRAIVKAGELGATRKDLEQSTGYLTQTLCARLNELESSQHIRKLTRLVDGAIEVIKREGCSVYVSQRGGDFEEVAA